MTKLGTIQLFFVARAKDGRLLYRSRNGAYDVLIPVNEQTMDLSYAIEIELSCCGKRVHFGHVPAYDASAPVQQADTVPE